MMETIEFRRGSNDGYRDALQGAPEGRKCYGLRSRQYQHGYSVGYRIGKKTLQGRPEGSGMRSMLRRLLS